MNKPLPVSLGYKTTWFLFRPLHLYFVSLFWNWAVFMWLYARLVFTNHLLPGPLFCMCWYSGFVDMPRGIRTLIVGRTKMKSCCRCLVRMKKSSLRFQHKSRLFLEKDQEMFWYQSINLCLMLIIYRFVAFLPSINMGLEWSFVKALLLAGACALGMT